MSDIKSQESLGGKRAQAAYCCQRNKVFDVRQRPNKWCRTYRIEVGLHDVAPSHFGTNEGVPFVTSDILRLVVFERRPVHRLRPSETNIEAPVSEEPESFFGTIIPCLKAVVEQCHFAIDELLRPARYFVDLGFRDSIRT